MATDIFTIGLAAILVVAVVVILLTSRARGPKPLAGARDDIDRRDVAKPTIPPGGG
jgi:hypothetical protein